MSNFEKPNMRSESPEGGMGSKQPTHSHVDEGPDADTIGGEMHNPKFNAQRDRDTDSAGARGSNHVGQGSERGSADPSAHATHQPTQQPMRKGNSEQDSFDEEEDQDMDMKLDESA